MTFTSTMRLQGFFPELKMDRKNWKQTMKMFRKYGQESFQRILSYLILVISYSPTVAGVHRRAQHVPTSVPSGSRPVTRGKAKTKLEPMLARDVIQPRCLNGVPPFRVIVTNCEPSIT